MELIFNTPFPFSGVLCMKNAFRGTIFRVNFYSISELVSKTKTSGKQLWLRDIEIYDLSKLM